MQRLVIIFAVIGITVTRYSNETNQVSDEVLFGCVVLVNRGYFFRHLPTWDRVGRDEGQGKPRMRHSLPSSGVAGESFPSSR